MAQVVQGRPAPRARQLLQTHIACGSACQHRVYCARTPEWEQSGPLGMGVLSTAIEVNRSGFTVGSGQTRAQRGLHLAFVLSQWRSRTHLGRPRAFHVPNDRWKLTLEPPRSKAVHLSQASPLPRGKQRTNSRANRHAPIRSQRATLQAATTPPATVPWSTSGVMVYQELSGSRATLYRGSSRGPL